MTCANPWRLVDTTRARYIWPPTPACLYATTPPYTRARKASSSTHLSGSVSKHLDSNPGAFKYALKKLIRKTTQVNSHPITSSRDPSSIHLRMMKSYIQFLTTPTADTPGTALLLHFDEKRYLIGNIHEGLQRAGVQSGLKFTKVTDIFLTGKTEWKSTGGLFGLILTLADAAEGTKLAIEAVRQKRARRRQQLEQHGVSSTAFKQLPLPSASEIAKPTLNIHGGPNLHHSIAAARRFIFRQSTPVNVFEYEVEENRPRDSERKPDWVDNHIQVWTLAINPSTGGDSIASSPPSRKRSHTEYAEADFPRSLFRNDTEEREKTGENQEILKNTVSEMFNSSWRIDELEERSLSEVGENALLFIRNSETKKLEKYKPPSSDGNTPLPDIKVLTRKAWPGALIDELPTSKPSQTALSYIIRNHRQRGKFLPKKALDLNVQAGPLFAKLAAGENVQARDGTTVTPEMVLAEGKDGGGIAVVDLPTAAYVENLVNRPEWHDRAIMTGVGGILWLLGAGVAENGRLQQFILDHDSLEHMISSPDDCSNYLAFSSAAASAIRLSQIYSNSYPIPIHNNNPSKQSNSQKPQVAIAQRGQKFQLEPLFEKQDDALVPILNTAKVLYCTPKEVLRLARVAREEIDQAKPANSSASQTLPSEDAEITCLGTGSALPSKYRNVAGTLLRVPGHGSYLLDCGENTLGQLKRVYGPEKLKEILRDLKLIWISHLHADHHLGTASVIKAWYEEVHRSGNGPSSSQSSVLDEFTDPPKLFTERDRLCVAGTHQMMHWLKEYASVEDYGYSKILPLASITRRYGRSLIEWHNKRINLRDGSKTSQALQMASGLEDLNACSVTHCWDAQAVTLTFASGLKVSYSGDCRPSKQFASIGKDSTVLIHEATFDDELRGDAIAKRHSTTTEAIGVGLAMQAKRVILTHFSQRYQKIPVMDNLETDKVQLEDVEEQEADVPIIEAGAGGASGEELNDDTTMNEAAASDDVVKSNQASTDLHNDDKPGISGSPTRKLINTEVYEKDTQPINGASEASALVSASKDMKICVAFDYMKVKVGDIEHMEKLNPALQELYQTGDLDNDPSEEITKSNVGILKQFQEPKAPKVKKSNEQINRGKSKRKKSPSIQRAEA